VTHFNCSVTLSAACAVAAAAIAATPANANMIGFIF
jgi:hypothetical protein